MVYGEKMGEKTNTDLNVVLYFLSHLVDEPGVVDHERTVLHHLDAQGRLALCSPRPQEEVLH